MQVVHARCCGLDVHKKTVVACVLLTSDDGTVQRYLRRFGTMTGELLARRHVAEARGYRLAGANGDRVRWEYRVFVDPYRQYRDVPPTEGTAELRISAGEIVALTLASTRESVRRREEAFLSASVADVHRRRATRDAPPAPSAAPPALRPLPAPPFGRGEAGAAPPDLVLTGLGALAAAVIRIRRQYGPEPGRGGGGAEGGTHDARSG